MVPVSNPGDRMDGIQAIDQGACRSIIASVGSVQARSRFRNYVVWIDSVIGDSLNNPKNSFVDYFEALHYDLAPESSLPSLVAYRISVTSAAKDVDEVSLVLSEADESLQALVAMYRDWYQVIKDPNALFSEYYPGKRVPPDTPISEVITGLERVATQLEAIEVGLRRFTLAPEFKLVGTRKALQRQLSTARVLKGVQDGSISAANVVRNGLPHTLAELERPLSPVTPPA